MRISKYLATTGLASRRKCEELVKNGEIEVNGKIVTDLAFQIDVEKDNVTYDGQKRRTQKTITIVLNKPTGYVCTANTEQAEKVIYDLLPFKERLFSIGRLDKMSEGLILVTNDGELSQQLTHPKYSIHKHYRVWVKGYISHGALKKLRTAGIYVDDIHYKAVQASVNRSIKDGGVIDFTLNEGKNQEIRNICRGINLQVKKLKRMSIGPISGKNLPSGRWRELTPKEIKDLRKLKK